MKNGFLILFASAFVLFSCGGSQKEIENETTETTSLINEDEINKEEVSYTKPSSPEEVFFGCQTIGSDEEGNSKYELYVHFDSYEVLIGKVDACSVLEKENYANYDIPDYAFAGFNSYFAGYGEAFYLVEYDDNSISLFKKEYDEMDTEATPFKEIGRYLNGKYTVVSSPNGN